MGNSSRGFTIIETVLFLAVTGLLILTIIAGAGTNINIQRYRDAVESFKSETQSQYANLNSVENGRGADYICDVSAKPIPDSNGELRGQSDCMIVGKYLRIDGSNIATYTIYAYETSSLVTAGTTDIQVLTNNYVFNALTTPDSDKELDWGTSIAWPKTLGDEVSNSSNPRTLGILFLRSPYSGQIYTFTSNDVPLKDSVSNSSIFAMIVDGENVPGRDDRVVCIESDGLFVNDNQALYIAPKASGPTSIETVTNEVLTTKGVAARC